MLDDEAFIINDYLSSLEVKVRFGVVSANTGFDNFKLRSVRHCLLVGLCMC